MHHLDETYKITIQEFIILDLQEKCHPIAFMSMLQTFQSLIKKILDCLIGMICYVYLDDIIMFSEDNQAYIEKLSV
jgi:hypothetical protein